MAATNPTARCRALLALVLSAPILVEGVASAQSTRAATLSRIEVTLQPATQRIVGRIRVTSRNASDHALDVVSFTLPVAGCARSFALESGASEVGLAGAGTLEIVSAAQVADDGSMRELLPVVTGDDRRRLELPIPGRLRVGEAFSVELRFRCHLDRSPELLVDGRDTYLCSGWYPEFDARECGATKPSLIRARLEAPARFSLAAGGGPRSIRDESVIGDKRVLAFELVDADRAAFVAQPNLVVRERTLGPFSMADDPTGVAQAMAKRGGLDATTFDLPELPTRVWLPRAFATVDRFDRYFRAARVAYEFFGLRGGAYPHSGLTILGVVRDELTVGPDAAGWIVAGAPAVLHPRDLQPERALLTAIGRSFWSSGASGESDESMLLDAIASFASARLEQLEYSRTVAPVSTTRIGGLVFAATPTPFVAHSEPGLYAMQPGLPLEAIRSRMPSRAAAFVTDAGFTGSFIPESPLLGLMESLPSAVACREVRTHGPLELRARWLAAAAAPRPWGGLETSDGGAGGEIEGTATLLWSLERLAGSAQWWSFLRALRSRCAEDVRLPTDDAIAELLAQHTSREIADFYRAASQPGATFDYGIESIVPLDGRGPEKVVVVRRLGTLRADVRVRFRFSDRSLPIVRVFEAGSPGTSRRFTFDDAAGLPFGDLLEVEIDPPHAATSDAAPIGNYPVDRNLLDNAWRASAVHDPAGYRAVRALLQVQSRLSFAGVIG